MGKLLERRKAVSHFAKQPDSGTVEHCTMSSDILGVNKEFSVYLPAGYEESDRRYPVMFLLHPAGGTHEIWISMGQLPQIADDAIRSGMAVPMIIVIPDASGDEEFHLGKHLGFFSVPGWDYEGFFHNELIPLIDSSYRTIADKKHRAITGASMGGEASIAYAQKHPEMYGTSCALCGILGHPEQSQMARTDKDYADSLVANNPSAFVENASAATTDNLKTVRWYTDCGDSDYFIEGNTEFFLAMKHKEIPIDFRVRSGVHGWYYWTTGLAPILHFISIGFLPEFPYVSQPLKR
ncbi:MAG: endo-1,4-beta-xylanase Z [Muribaculaceae bacterium]|nr:endo-1,4-beta-xylanase Z [Muribaculaceae bacterium]